MVSSGTAETMGWKKQDLAQGKKSCHSTFGIQFQDNQCICPTKGCTPSRDHHLCTKALSQILTARLSKKKRFLERAEYIIDQSKVFSKTGQKSLHEYLNPFASQQKAYKSSITTAPRQTIQRTQTQSKVSVSRYICWHDAHIAPSTPCKTHHCQIFVHTPIQGSDYAIGALFSCDIECDHSFE